MQVRGNQQPAQFWLEVDGNTATAYFTENVKKIDEPDDDGKPGFHGWEYDRYKIDLQYDDGLQARINKNIPEWLSYVKFDEKVKKTNEFLVKRRELLAATDWTALRDSPVSGEKRQAYEDYRKALRDIPEDVPTFPYGIVYPAEPSGD